MRLAEALGDDVSSSGRSRKIENHSQRDDTAEAALCQRSPGAGKRTKLLLDIKVSPALGRERVVRETQAARATLDVIVGVQLRRAELAALSRSGVNGIPSDYPDVLAGVLEGREAGLEP